MLLEYGIGSQRTALKLAVPSGDENMLQFLLDGCFKVWEYGCAALYTAKMKGDRGMIELVESRGATLGLPGEAERGSGMRKMGVEIGVLVVCMLCLSIGVMMWLRSDSDAEDD